MSRFLHIAAALVFLAHGFAHIVGFVGHWRLSEKIPYRTTILGGRVDLGPAGGRLLGIVWLLLALNFALVAWGVAARTIWWQTGALAAAGVSLILCLTEWPDGRIGAAVNVAIIVVLLVLSAR
jgi:hypothetical protein